MNASPAAADNVLANGIADNLNERWLNGILDVLTSAGIRRAVLSPGGRSAAMAFAIHRQPAFSDLLISTDERSGAYTALGMIKATGESAIAVTTSGSAVANLVPALTEADECGLPLVLITCDRPRTLRHTGFGQMTDHIGACRAFVRASVDLPDPLDDANAIAQIKEHVAAVLRQRHGRRPGPVQINIPLADDYDPTERRTISAKVWQATKVFADSCFERRSAPSCAPIVNPQIGAKQPAFSDSSPTPFSNDIDALIRSLQLRPGIRGLIVAGPECGVPLGMLADFVARLGYPVLADAASGLRGTGHASVLSGFDALSVPSKLAAETPDLIIRFGLAPVMPLVQTYLLAHPCPTIKVSATAQQQDYLHPSFTSLVMPSCAELETLAAVLTSGNPLWRNAWCAIASHAARVRGAVVDGLPWGELPAVREIFQHDSFEFLHLGNSMPIRHGDLFYETRANHQLVYSNRGVSGIDGTLSTFLGEAIAIRRRGLLVVGDLAFIHDLPALANVQRHTRPACVCVINNGGGAIFDFLPLARLPDYQTVIRNPYQFEIGQAATAFGLRYARCEDRAALRDALDTAAVHNGVTIVEVLVPAGSAVQGLKQVQLALYAAQ